MASLAEQQATYYRDPDTGFLMMPGTRRPDGTWRKPRRIKEGYVPQDEVPLYESKGKQFAKASAGHIPGLGTGNDSDPNNTYSSGGNMHIGKLSAGILNMKIDTFDSRTTPAVGIPGLALDAGNPLGLPSGGKSKSSKKKNKNKNADKGLMAVNPPAASISSQCERSCMSSSNKRSNGDSFTMTNNELNACSLESVVTDPAKKLRNLRKKLRDIEAVEKKLEEGVISKPEPEQLEKVARKIQVETEIDELERELDIEN
jgi:partner of Y14 and mago protein